MFNRPLPQIGDFAGTRLGHARMQVVAVEGGDAPAATPRWQEGKLKNLAQK